MSKSSSSKFVLSNLYHYILSKPQQFSNPNVTSSGISHFLSNHSKIIEKGAVNPWISNSQRTHFSSSPFTRVLQNPSKKLDSDGSFLWNRKLLGFRYFSLKSSAFGSKISGSFGKNVLKNPVEAAKNTALRYKGAVGLQMEAFWKRNSMVLFGAAGIMVCILLWRVLFGIATTFIGLSEGMAKYGFLALSSAIVAFAVSSFQVSVCSWLSWTRYFYANAEDICDV